MLVFGASIVFLWSLDVGAWSLFRRVLQLSPGLQKLGQSCLNQAIPRIELQGRPKLLLGVVKFSLCGKNETEIAMRRAVFGVETKDGLEFFSRSGQLILLAKHQTQ